MSSFTKLKSGEWGIRGSAGEVVAGKTVVVTKRDGTSKTVTVGRVIWTGDGKALATVGNGSQTRDPKARPETPRRREAVSTTVGAGARRRATCADRCGARGREADSAMTTELLRLRGAHAPGTVVQVEGTYYRLARGSWAGPGVWAVRGTVVPEPEEVRAAREIEARISELRAVPNDWTHYDGAAVGGSVAFAGIEVELVPNRCPPQSEWVLLGEAHEVYPASRYARRYRAGRYLIVEHGDFDDWRRAILIPPDLVDAYFAAEQAARGIDQAEAEKWLAQYRGCVGTQLYEWVVAGSREGGNQ